MMKTFISKNVLTCGVSILLFTAVDSALAQAERTQTAKQALSVLHQAKGPETMRGIMGMRAVKGQHQPKQWEIVTASRTGVQRYFVGNERILSSDQPRNAKPARPLNVRELKVDSTSAFRIADNEARSAQVGFDTIDYELRGDSNGATPIWRVKLRDSYGELLGAVDIDGQSGSVLNKKWNAAGVTGATGGGDYDDAPSGEYGEIYDDYSSGSGGASDYDTGAYQDSYGAGAADYYDSTDQGDAYRDPRQPRIDYSQYEGVDNRESDRVDRYYRANENLRERLEVDPVDAKERAKNGFIRIGDSFRDIFKGRASYRSTGKRHHSANRVAKGR